MGISEGGSRSLNLTAPALFNATDKTPIRPAYNDENLLRAINSGIAGNGRLLNATMPRYRLTRTDAQDLIAYLHTLGVAPPVGVNDDRITIVSVLADRTPSHEKDAIVRVISRFVEQKNSESRLDRERADVSNRHVYGRNRQRAYREWDFSIWTLHGEVSNWPEQLRNLYDKHAPFAIVSGSTGSDWNIVHEFCEAREIPCILPFHVPVVPPPDDDFFSLYFSAGFGLEAAVTAAHIRASSGSLERKVLIVAKDVPESRNAAEKMTRNLGTNDEVQLLLQPDGKPISKRRWRSILTDSRPDVLVAWLAKESISTLDETVAKGMQPPNTIYTAHRFTDWLADAPPTSHLTPRIHHVYPYSLPVENATQFPRENFWFKHNKLSDLDPVSAAKALYACRVLGMGLADIQTSFSREYFLEALEHALDGTQLTSLFPRTSLGPGQRLLSRGAHVVQLANTGNIRFFNAEWIQP